MLTFSVEKGLSRRHYWHLLNLTKNFPYWGSGFTPTKRVPPRVAHERVFRFLRNTPRGVRPEKYNLRRRSNRSKGYALAYICVAPTPSTLSHIQPQPQRKICIHTTNKRIHFTKHHSSSHKPHVHTGKRFLRSFFLKKRVFCQAFLHKKADLLTQTKATFKVHGRTFLHKKSNTTSYTPFYKKKQHPTIHKYPSLFT